MAELKTKPTEQSVEGFLRGVSPEQKRQDCLAYTCDMLWNERVYLLEAA